MQNNFITLFLNFHETLKNLKGLRGIGKQLTAKICDLLTEKAILGNQYKRGDQSKEKNLYTYAKQQITKQISSTINEFETLFLQKLILAKKSINKSLEFKESLRMTEQWLVDKNSEFRMDMFDLNQILTNLSQNYIQQIQFIEMKWVYLSPMLLGLEEKPVDQQLKKFMLHISFQTYIDNSLITNWQKIMMGLQSKRYK